MIPRSRGDFFQRRWLDDGSMAATRSVVTPECASFTLSDGQSAVTLDFSMATEDDRKLAHAKAVQLRTSVEEFTKRLELLTVVPAVLSGAGTMT